MQMKSGNTHKPIKFSVTLIRLIRFYSFDAIHARDQLTRTWRLQSFQFTLNLCSKCLNRLRNSDLVLMRNDGFPWRNVTSKMRNIGKLIPFVFGTKILKCVVSRAEKGQLAFSKKQQQLRT